MWGIKKSYSFSPPPFGSCLNKLEKIVHQVAKGKELDVPKHMQEIIIIFIFANSYVLPLFNVEAMQHSLGVVETFCQDRIVSNNY